MFSLRKPALNLSFTKLRKGIKGCICHTQVSFRYVRLGNMVKLSFQVLPSSNHCVPKREGIVRLEFYHEARLSWRLTNVLLTHCHPSRIKVMQHDVNECYAFPAIEHQNEALNRIAFLNAPPWGNWKYRSTDTVYFVWVWDR